MSEAPGGVIGEADCFAALRNDNKEGGRNDNQEEPEFGQGATRSGACQRRTQAL